MSMAAIALRPQECAASCGKILCLDQYGSIGGGQRSLLDLLPAFSQSGWDVRAAITGFGALHDNLRRNGYRTYSLPGRTYSSMRKRPLEILNYAAELPGIAAAVRMIVNTEGIDLLYVNGPRLLPPAAWVAQKTHIPLVFHCHNRLFQESAIILAGESLRLANARVIASCHYAAAPIKDYVWPERLKIVYNGVRQIAVNRRREPSDTWRIGVIGRVEKEKGQLEFVRAAKLVTEKLPGCRFYVIGSPLFSTSDYYRRVRATAGNAPVDFIEWQNDLSAIYSQLDLAVIPSNDFEATTRVILEAFSAGLPVIAFPSGGIPEVLEDEQTGFLTKEPTSEALADRILAIARMNPACLDCVVKRAKTEWAHRFTLEAYRDSVTDVLMQASHASGY